MLKHCDCMQLEERLVHEMPFETGVQRIKDETYPTS